MKNKIGLTASILLVSGILSGCLSYETINVESSSEDTSITVTSESAVSSDGTSVDVSSETTGETYEFKSGVSSMEAYKVGSDGSEVLLYSEEYDENGNVVKRTDYKDGKIDSTTSNAYDQDGKLRNSQKDISGFFFGTMYCFYQYDESGNLLKESFTAHYDCSDTTQPSYDSEGYKDYVYENGLLVKVSESQTDYEADIYTTTSHEEYEYDDKGQLIKTTVYSSGTNSEEVLSCEIVFEYDEEGRLIKKTKSFADGSDKVESYEYDGSGNLVKTVSDDGTILSKYDEENVKISDQYDMSGDSYTIEYRKDQ